jgi:Zn-dependent protease
LTELAPVVWLIVFVISVTTHEAAHAAAAYLGGDRTAYLGGQLTLNPLPHMRREPFGMVLMPIVSSLTMGFPLGWASTPFDPTWQQRYPRRAAWMAAAGPAANLALAALAFAIMRVGLATSFFGTTQHPDYDRMVMGHVNWIDGFGRFLSMMLVLNTVLCLFNLIPFPPLDGASAISLVLPARAALQLRQALRQPAIALIGFLALWWGFGYAVQPVIHGLYGLLVSRIS